VIQPAVAECSRSTRGAVPLSSTERVTLPLANRSLVAPEKGGVAPDARSDSADFRFTVGQSSWWSHSDPSTDATLGIDSANVRLRSGPARLEVAPAMAGGVTLDLGR
jgi:hypothetical protein